MNIRNTVTPIAFIFFLMLSVFVYANEEKDVPSASNLYTELSRINDLINTDLPEKPAYCDSLALVMIEMAETSRQPEAICLAYHYLSHQYLNYHGLRNNLEIAASYTKKYEDAAKNYNLEKYIIFSQLRQARLSRAHDNLNKALEYNNLALSRAAEFGSDSIISLCYSSVHNTWLGMDNYVAAFQALLSAREFAEKSKSAERILLSMEDLGSFYFEVDEYEKSKNIFFEVEKLGRKNQEWESVMVAQRSIASNYIEQDQKPMAMKFFEKAMHIADSVGRSGYKINIYIDIINFLLNKESRSKALAFFNKTPELKTFLLNIGAAHELDKLMGLYYVEKNLLDSAAYYYKRYEPYVLESNSDENITYNLDALRLFYKARKDLPNERRILNQMLKLADSTTSIHVKAKVYAELDTFYTSAGNYQQAFFYNNLADKYNDSIENVTKKNELIHLELDNEAKRKQKQEAEAAEVLRQRNNLQYMAITISIIIVFVVLTLLGVFKASETLIKTLGFFAFIFLFEFIILILDHQIHHYTHGEPWKILAIKIVLIAMLLPLHHWLEHKVIHYLTNKDLLWKTKKKSTHNVNAEHNQS